ncbi:hypothetical protein EMIT0196MI5_40241 [Pseudomonas sp. IT-196MI5]
MPRANPLAKEPAPATTSLHIRDPAPAVGGMGTLSGGLRAHLLVNQVLLTTLYRLIAP